MSRSPYIRLAVAALLGALAAAAVIGVLVLVNADAGFSGCTATTGLGWLVPIIAGLVIAWVAFALMSDRPIGSTEESAPAVQTRCADCGGIIRGDWRLCPHCGTRLS